MNIYAMLWIYVMSTAVVLMNQCYVACTTLLKILKRTKTKEMKLQIQYCFLNVWYRRCLTQSKQNRCLFNRCTSTAIKARSGDESIFNHILKWSHCSSASQNLPDSKKVPLQCSALRQYSRNEFIFHEVDKSSQHVNSKIKVFIFPQEKCSL